MLLAKYLDLSEEETIQLASRKRQRQTPEQAQLQDAFNTAYQDIFDAQMPQELDGVHYKSDESWAFGQMQDDLNTYNANDFGYVQ